MPACSRTSSEANNGALIRTARAIASEGREETSLVLPSRAHTNGREEGLVDEVVDHDALHLGVGLIEDVPHQIVGHGPGCLDALEGEGDGSGLDRANPYR